MQHRPNNECFLKKFVKLLQLLQRQHGSNCIVPKFLNDARGRNKIKVGFNYFSL